MEGLASLLQQSLPYVIGWAGVGLAARCVSPCLSPTYRTLSAGDKSYWASSVVSSVFAVTVTALAVRALVDTPALYSSTDILMTTPLTNQSFLCFFGYILQDTCQWPFYGGDASMLIHHFAVLWCWSQMIVGGFCHFMGLVGLIAEITTPFVNFRWFFDKAGMKEGQLYFANGCTLLGLWFLSRVVGFLFLGCRLYAARDGIRQLALHQQVTSYVCYSVGLSLQLFWFSKIARGAIKTIRAAKKRG